MNVLTPLDSDFNYEQCKSLYENNQYLLEDDEIFDNVIKNTFFYSFFIGRKHIGCIYYYEQNNKLYINAVAYRGTHLINIACLKESLTWWNCDIYARTHHKTAIYTILECGFKKIGKNLYKYER